MAARNVTHHPAGRALEPAPRTPPPLPADSPLLKRDPWPWAQPYALDGWAEREGFHPLLMAFLAAIATWLVFQGVATLATGVLLLDEIREVGVGRVEEIIPQHPNVVFGANAIGQLVGLLMFTILLARLHTAEVFPFLRIRRTDPAFYVLSGAGLLALMPFVSWIGGIARELPYPEGVREFDEAQRVLLERIFAAEVHLGLALLFVALTPAICEEVIFRGYLQRNVERALGAVASILLVGFLFGVFHLRITEFIPLSILGIYLGYVVWVSGSLWAGVLVHLLNNGIAVLVSHYAQNRPDPVAIDEILVPWYYALAGLALVVALVLAMHRRRRLHLAATAAPSD